MKLSKAFTLAEIFVTIVIISVIVAICVNSFTNNRKDFSREYMYYTTYQTLVKVVDNALMNEDYFNKEVDDISPSNGTNKKVVVNDIPCGTSSNKTACRTFNPNIDLCRIFAAYTNHVQENVCKFSPPVSWDNIRSLKKITLNNGIVITFLQSAYAFASLETDRGGLESHRYNVCSSPADYDADSGIQNSELCSFVLYVDIDGLDRGENVNNYDRMWFYITVSGKVVPWYGTTSMRGYTTNAAGFDAAGNPALMAFDVVYTDNDNNMLKVVPEGRNVSFPEAACMSGYLNENLNYCKWFEFNNQTGETRSNGVKKHTTCTETADCYPRLVQKMKWSR